jgi:hypothetical protein
VVAQVLERDGPGRGALDLDCDVTLEERTERRLVMVRERDAFVPPAQHFIRPC